MRRAIARCRTAIWSRRSAGVTLGVAVVVGLVLVGDELAVVADVADRIEIDIQLIRSKCRRASLLHVGIPSDEDKAAVAHEDVPERVQADFKTTVDETDYRG